MADATSCENALYRSPPPLPTPSSPAPFWGISWPRWDYKIYNKSQVNPGSFYGILLEKSIYGKIIWHVDVIPYNWEITSKSGKHGCACKKKGISGESREGVCEGGGGHAPLY